MLTTDAVQGTLGGVLQHVKLLLIGVHFQLLDKLFTALGEDWYVALKSFQAECVIEYFSMWPPRVNFCRDKSSPKTKKLIQGDSLVLVH